MVSLTQLQEIPPKNLILLVGPPGSGKSTFCQQTVLNNIEVRPVIYLTTESTPSKVTDLLKEYGLGDTSPYPISFINAFHETVGLSKENQIDAVDASSENLLSLGIAISKLRKNMKEKFLLVFDSLTAPYLMTGSEILKFMRNVLLKLTAEGNAILVCMDEGCGKSEDLVAMMSMADGIVKIELQDGLKFFNVMKYPNLKPTKIQVPLTYSYALPYRFDHKMRWQSVGTSFGFIREPPLRKKVGDFVHIFWMNLGRWSGMLWDPKRFPTMVYNSNKHIDSTIKNYEKFQPWRIKLYFKLYMPKRFSKVKDMKKLSRFPERMLKGDRFGIYEYKANASKTDEHYCRVYENAMCWGFDNVGASLTLGMLGVWAGYMKGYEKADRDWNIVEKKCIGLGDPYCESKMVPGEIDELQHSLEAIDSTIIERIYDLLIKRLMGYMFHGQPLWKERPRLGNHISLHAYSNIMVLPAFESEKYRTAIRLGGVLVGKKVGEQMMETGIKEDEAVHHIVNFLEHCKVGKVTMGETFRIRESCESTAIEAKEPSCVFTTGFLNGFFSAVKNLHIKETKCISMGDSYCEWEFR